jgi:hypothetical protein
MIPRWVSVTLFILCLPLILAYVVLWLLFWLVAASVLLAAVWIAWCPRGRNVLAVYSNSPIWQVWFEQHALPALGSRAVVLNWSERKQWKRSLAVLLFRVFGGTRNFNPIVIVFTPLRLPRTFRFYRAFQEFKHGRPQEVERMWSEVLNAI